MKSADALWSRGTLGKKPGGDVRILFSQVHEDASVEVALLTLSHVNSSRPVAFAIGSGGCTAFSLLSASPAQLHIVDINPAQVFLIELKQAAMETLSRDEVLGCFHRNAQPFYARLRPHINSEAQHFWDARPSLLSYGLSQCGVIERILHCLGHCLPLLQGRGRTERMFRHTDLQKQRAYYFKSWDNWRWQLVFALLLSKPILRLLYARDFITEVPEDFASSIKKRVDDTFTRFPIFDNGYLWQTFRGCYPPHDNALPIYVRRQHFEIVKSGLPNTTVQHADAATWLEAEPASSIDFFALSNILEITTPEYSSRLLEAVARAARPGAIVCLRSIFPAAPATSPASPFQYEPELSQQLAQQDRSLFCKNIRVMRRLS